MILILTKISFHLDFLHFSLIPKLNNYKYEITKIILSILLKDCQILTLIFRMSEFEWMKHKHKHKHKLYEFHKYFLCHSQKNNFMNFVCFSEFQSAKTNDHLWIHICCTFFKFFFWWNDTPFVFLFQMFMFIMYLQLNKQMLNVNKTKYINGIFMTTKLFLHKGTNNLWFWTHKYL